jgi:hypothetical protein
MPHPTRWRSSVAHPSFPADSLKELIDLAKAKSGQIQYASAGTGEQIVGLLKGARPPCLVNPEVWPAYVARFEAVMGAHVQTMETTLE